MVGKVQVGYEKVHDVYVPPSECTKNFTLLVKKAAETSLQKVRFGWHQAHKIIIFEI